MNAYEFYHSTSLLLSRLDYAVDMERASFKPSGKEESKGRKWTHLAFDGLEIFTGIEVPWHRRNVWIELDRSEEEQEELKRHWYELTEDFPLAGLRFSNGLPVAFAAKLADGDIGDIVDLFETKHDEFKKFAQEHVLAISRQGGSYLTLCIAFSNSERFLEAREKVERMKSKSALLNRAFTMLWLFDLHTLELATARSLNLKGIGAMEYLSSVVPGRRDAQDIEEWSSPSKLLTWGIIGPRSFTEFTRLYLDGTKDGRIEIPQEVKDRFEAEEAKHERRICQAELRAIDGSMVDCHLRLGEILHERYQAGNRIGDEAAPPLERAEQESTRVRDLETRRGQLVKARGAWVRSEEKLARLRAESSALEKELETSYAQLGESLFEHEQELVRRDETLKAVFATSLELQARIHDRQAQIEDVESGRTGLFGNMKGKAHVLYLRGLNEKDRWNVKQNCRSAGSRAFEHLAEVPSSSPVLPLWNTIEDLRSRLRGYEEAVQRHARTQTTITYEVEDLAGTRQPGSHPWHDLERHFEEELEELRSVLSRSLTSAGREFRRAGRTVGEGEAAEIEAALSQLESKRKSVGLQLVRLESEAQ